MDKEEKINIYELDKQRLGALKYLYFLTKGSTQGPAEISLFFGEKNISESETRKILYYLDDEGLIKIITARNCAVQLTHAGLKKVESLLRKIDYSEEKVFDPTEIMQLQMILNEVKDQLRILSLGQEVIFEKIDELYEYSKNTTKSNWEEYFREKVKDWTANKIIDETASIILKGIILGLKISY